MKTVTLTALSLLFNLQNTMGCLLLRLSQLISNNTTYLIWNITVETSTHDCIQFFIQTSPEISNQVLGHLHLMTDVDIG